VAVAARGDRAWCRVERGPAPGRVLAGIGRTAEAIATGPRSRSRSRNAPDAKSGSRQPTATSGTAGRHRGCAMFLRQRSGRPRSSLVTDLARHNGSEVSLQECGAHVRNAVVSRTPTRRSRAPATRSAASQRSWLPRPRNRPELIRQGVYSPALHDATQAVEWFRATLVRALHRRSSTLSRT
jgi:hypothetical protein